MTGIFEGMCFFMENRRDHVSSGERGKKRRGVHSQAGIGTTRLGSASGCAGGSVFRHGESQRRPGAAVCCNCGTQFSYGEIYKDLLFPPVKKVKHPPVTDKKETVKTGWGR